MISKFLPRSMTVAACLLLAACNQPTTGGDAATGAAQSADTSAAVAVVNGEPVSEALLDTFAQSRIRKRAADLSDDERAQAIDELINLKVLASRAEQDGYANSAEFVSQLELQKINMLAQSLVRNYMEGHPITDEAVQARFDEQASTGGSTEYKARHILLESKEVADEVIALLNAGGDFAEIATEKSTGPTGPRGGDLGWFMLDKMVKPFGDAVAAMELGTYSKEPVQTQFGWHVILVEETRSTPFAQVKDRLRSTMQRESLETYVDGLKAESQITLEGA